MELKRLGFEGTIDILDRESNGSITAMEVEVHDQSRPKKAKRIAKRSVSERRCVRPRYEPKM